jgi:hypothetical protein
MTARLMPVELGAASQHGVHDDRETSGERDPGLAHRGSFGDRESAALDPLENDIGAVEHGAAVIRCRCPRTDLAGANEQRGETGWNAGLPVSAPLALPESHQVRQAACGAAEHQPVGGGTETRSRADAKRRAASSSGCRWTSSMGSRSPTDRARSSTMPASRKWCK